MAAANYDACIKAVLQYEGGYTNNAADPGGPTNWGITIIDARRYWKPDATKEDVRAMPLDVAKTIYRRHYWDALKCDLLPAGVDECVFDYGVNSGISRSAKVLQAILGLPQDGQIGPATLQAVAKHTPLELINRICDERLAFLKRLKTWSTFGVGWGRRVASVRMLSLHMAAGPSSTAQHIIQAPTPSMPMAKGVPTPPTVTPATKTASAIAVAGAGVAAAAATGGVDWFVVAAIAVGGALIAGVVFSIMRNRN